MITRSWWLVSNDTKKGKIYPRQCIKSNQRNIYKNWQAKGLLGLYLSEEIPNYNNNKITERNMRCNICITKLWNYMSKQIEILK